MNEICINLPYRGYHGEKYFRVIDIEGRVSLVYKVTPDAIYVVRETEFSKEVAEVLKRWVRAKN